MEYWSNGKALHKTPRSNSPLVRQNALDGVLRCFMLRRFSRPNRARGEGPVEIGRLRRMNALLLGLESFC
jgi:hypothetical protein